MSAAEKTPATAPGEARSHAVTAVPVSPFGKYTLIGKLGHGGMAEVNLAVMSGKGNFRKLVVIKRMHAHLEAEPGFVDMFLDEARLAAQLDHPHCVQTLEVGEANGQHFLAMEYLDGQGLERLLRITGQRGETLPPGLVARMVADALDGLSYAHELTDYEGKPLGVVHRDISPQNLFVTYAGVVKLLDFGIAKAASNVVETRTGVIKGKYAYIAPEQALATGHIDARADVWAMGVVMWEMLTTRRLFKSHNELATLQETLTGTIHPPSTVVPSIPAELDRIVLRALTRDVAQRYQSAAEFKEDLERWLATAPDRAERRDIAKLMQERFGDAMKAHRAKIGECLAAVAQGDKSVQRLIEGGTVSASGEMAAGMPSMTPPPGGTPYLTPSGISLSPKAIAGPISGPGHVVGGPYPTPAPMPMAAPAAAPPYGSQAYGSPPSGSLPPSSGGYGMPYPTPMPAPLPPGVAVPSGAYAPSGMTPPPGAYVPSGMTPPPGAYVPSGMTPPPGSSFAPAPPKQDERRPFAMVLVLLGLVALLAVVGLVVWPSFSGPSSSVEPSPPPGVGVVVVGGTVAPTTSVTVVPAPVTEVVVPTSVVPTADDPGSAHRPHRPRTDTHAETTVVAPPPPPPPTTTAPAPSAGGEGFLSLMTSPWAHVTEGGRDIGDTPLVRFPMSAGHHTLTLVNDEQHIRETYDVDITAGQLTSRRLGLQ